MFLNDEKVIIASYLETDDKLRLQDLLKISDKLLFSNVDSYSLKMILLNHHCWQKIGIDIGKMMSAFLCHKWSANLFYLVLLVFLFSFGKETSFLNHVGCLVIVSGQIHYSYRTSFVFKKNLILILFGQYVCLYWVMEPYYMFSSLRMHAWVANLLLQGVIPLCFCNIYSSRTSRSIVRFLEQTTCLLTGYLGWWICRMMHPALHRKLQHIEMILLRLNPK